MCLLAPPFRLFEKLGNAFSVFSSITNSLEKELRSENTVYTFKSFAVALNRKRPQQEYGIQHRG